MRERRIERCFERFRRHGDVKALGLVFDRTGPELLRVAASLSSRLAEAEDLVQATFLSAIERAERWDDSQRLVPWLLGILVRHAHEARRKKARERDEAPEEPEQREAALGGLEREELALELERALDALPPRDRDVLRPFLVEGRAPVEIARERGEAPGTVRMRIHRGLARLRRALPAGLGLGAAVDLGSGRGLAAVRAEVLASASSSPLVLGAAPLAPAFPLAGVLGGSLVIQKIALAMVALALALGLAWIAWPSGVQAPPALGAADPSLALAPSAERATSPHESEPASSDRSLRRVDADERPVSDASFFERSLSGVHGRLSTHEREPVAHVEIALLELDPAMQLRAYDALTAGTPAPLRIEVGRTRTDAEGRFALEGARASGMHALGVDLGGPRATLVFLDPDLRTGESADLGDVVLAPAGRIVGSVVDESGAPLAGAEVRAANFPDWFEKSDCPSLRPGAALGFRAGSQLGFELAELPSWIDAWYARLPIPTARTDARGRFELESVAAGTVSLLVTSEGRPPVLVHAVAVPAAGRCDAGALVLPSGRPIAGRVVDERGEPVADVEVRATTVFEVPAGTALSNAVFAPIRRTDPAGRFRFEGLPVRPLALVALRRAHGAWRIEGPLAASEELVLAIDPGAELELALRSKDGAPIERASIALAPDGPMSHPQMPASLSSLRGIDVEWPAPGLARLAGLEPGAYRLRVSAPGFADTFTEIAVEAGGTRSSIELVPARELGVRVLDARNGAALADCEVSVRAFPSREPALEGARTDAGGEARFERVPAGADEPLELRVEHPAFALYRAPLDPGAVAVEVRLGEGGALEALVHRSGAPPDPPLLLEIGGSRVKGVDPLFLVATDARGRVHLERLAAGEYRYSVHERRLAQGNFELLGAADAMGEELASGSFRIAEGETTRLEILLGVRGADAASGGARITGRITLDGEPLGGLQVVVSPRFGYARGNSTRTADDGSYELEGLVAGESTISVVDLGAAGSPLARGFQEHELVRLAPGETRVLDFDWRRFEVELDVRAPDGAAVVGANALLRAQDEDGHLTVAHGTTGADGLARVVVTRSGAWTASVNDARTGSGEGAFDVASATTRVRLELEVGVPCAGEVVLPEFASDGPPSLLLVDLARGRSLGVELERDRGRLRFRAAGLRSGRFQAQMLGGRPRLRPIEFELPERGDEALVLRFEPADGTNEVRSAQPR